MQTRNSFAFLRFSKRSANNLGVCGMGGEQTAWRFSPPRPLLFHGAPRLEGETAADLFWRVMGSDLRLVRSITL